MTYPNKQKLNMMLRYYTKAMAPEKTHSKSGKLILFLFIYVRTKSCEIQVENTFKVLASTFFSQMDKSNSLFLYINAQPLLRQQH